MTAFPDFFINFFLEFFFFLRNNKHLEQIVSSSGHGKKADVWALGCLIIEMLTGRPPWGEADNPIAALFKILTSNGPLVPDEDGEGVNTILR